MPGAVSKGGARQVGKTWLMKEFGRQDYADTIYINFDSNSGIAELFASDLDTDRLIMGLELYTGRKIDPDNSLLIFDEVIVPVEVKAEVNLRISAFTSQKAL